MTEREDQLREVLDGYAKFLQDNNLTMDKHQPYFVRRSGLGEPFWMRPGPRSADRRGVKSSPEHLTST